MHSRSRSKMVVNSVMKNFFWDLEMFIRLSIFSASSIVPSHLIGLSLTLKISDIHSCVNGTFLSILFSKTVRTIE